MTSKKPNQKQMILEAAKRIHERHQRDRLPEEFSDAELVIEVWHEHKETFGLKPFHAMYPDSGKVMANVYGTRGLLQDRSLVPVGEKEFVYAGAGKPSNVLPAFLQFFATEVLASKVYSIYKTESTRRNAITFRDAIGFWKEATGVKASTTQAVADFNIRMRTLRMAVRPGVEYILNDGGRTVTREDVEHVAKMNQWLRRRFETSLKKVQFAERLERRRGDPILEE